MDGDLASKARMVHTGLTSGRLHVWSSVGFPACVAVLAMFFGFPVLVDLIVRPLGMVGFGNVVVKGRLSDGYEAWILLLVVAVYW